jgi:hypothetical protein
MVLNLQTAGKNGESFADRRVVGGQQADFDLAARWLEKKDDGSAPVVSKSKS